MEYIDDLGVKGYKLIQNDNCFKFGTDAVLLANFISNANGKKICDLGCSSGAIGILLCAYFDKALLLGVDISEPAIELLNKNIKINGVENRFKALCTDLKQIKNHLPAGEFDYVVSNPPYFDEKSGPVSTKAHKAAARSEISCSVFDVCQSAAHLLKFGGKLAVIYRTDRLCDLIFAMRQVKIEPKKLRLVQANPQKIPSLVLVEGQKGAKNGIITQKNLILLDEKGNESEELKKIYRRRG